MEKGNTDRCILLGLPQSGKSTFIAALWHVVESNELKGSYTVKSLPKDREYLNFLRESWLQCKPVERTKTDFLKNINLKFYNEMNELTEFIFPDVSGEMFSSQIENRKIDNSYIDLVREASGIILFINPNLIKKPFLISDAFVDLVENNESSEGRPWSVKDLPTQVALVELLQVMSLYAKRPVRLAVAISAWDEILDAPDKEYSALTPNNWLIGEVPLLSQYLQSNEDLYNHKVFGISAQGSRYQNDSLILHECEKPSERIKVHDGNDITHDITLPIKWLIEQDDV